MKFKHIPVEQIRITGNIRSDVDEEIGELMESIDQYDVLQPLLVIPAGDQYELISGHRRFAAMKGRNESTVPCIVRNDIERRDIGYIKLVENVQRKQLSPRELVKVFNDMLEQNPKLTKKTLARYLGKSDAWVYDKYKAERIYNELLLAGLDESTINDLSEADLKHLGNVRKPVERAEKAAVVAGAPQDKRRSIIESAESHEKDLRGTSRDMSGGFYVSTPGRCRVLVVCGSREVRDLVVKTLLKLKIERMDVDDEANT